MDKPIVINPYSRQEVAHLFEELRKELKSVKAQPVTNGKRKHTKRKGKREKRK